MVLMNTLTFCFVLDGILLKKLFINGGMGKLLAALFTPTSQHILYDNKMDNE